MINEPTINEPTVNEPTVNEFMEVSANFIDILAPCGVSLGFIVPRPNDYGKSRLVCLAPRI